MSRIHLRELGHSYADGVYALKPTDLVFEHGKTYALLGPSGCGKTTMLNIISGLLQPSEGRVFFDEQDMTVVPTVKRNIAQVFQFPVVYQSKTVFENLAFPLQCRSWERSRITPRVNEIADMLGLTSRLGRPARDLTVDEKQLISLGRGLVRDDVAAILAGIREAIETLPATFGAPDCNWDTATAAAGAAATAGLSLVAAAERALELATEIAAAHDCAGVFVWEAADQIGGDRFVGEVSRQQRRQAESDAAGASLEV